MVSIYSRLFRYREREHRSPLEDFLSEALVDLLNKLPLDKHIDLIGTLFLPQEAAARKALEKLTAHSPQLLWHTQTATKEGGRIDILLKCSGLPILVIENKISAQLRTYPRAVEGDDTYDGSDIEEISENQLQKYGRWLAEERKPEEWPGAIAYLTHVSSAPMDFEQRNETYGVPWRRTCKWHEVWKWLDLIAVTETEEEPSTICLWQGLAREFARFLEDRGMSSETATHHDFAALGLFIHRSGRISNTFSRISDSPRVKEILTDMDCKKASNSEGYDSDGGVVWGWAYLKDPSNWYVAWGMRFPECSKWWKELGQPFQVATHAFVCLAYYDRKSAPDLPKLPPNQLPPKWTYASTPTGDWLVVACSIHEFPFEPDELTRALSDWVGEQLTTLKKHLPRIRKTASAMR